MSFNVDVYFSSLYFSIILRRCLFHFCLFLLDLTSSHNIRTALQICNRNCTFVLRWNIQPSTRNSGKEKSKPYHNCHFTHIKFNFTFISTNYRALHCSFITTNGIFLHFLRAIASYLSCDVSGFHAHICPKWKLYFNTYLRLSVYIYFVHTMHWLSDYRMSHEDVIGCLAVLLAFHLVKHECELRTHMNMYEHLTLNYLEMKNNRKESNMMGDGRTDFQSHLKWFYEKLSFEWVSMRSLKYFNTCPA